ncbi:MAG: GNAT family N-acetyltransferase [Actinobacteria bacterium]|nr:GNAT family N-acetyltransferase [Actinomycetota bacterium]
MADVPAAGGGHQAPSRTAAEPDLAPEDPAAPGFPAQWEADVVLTDGGTMHLRPIRPDDAARIERFHERQSPESIYFRYFSPRPRLTSRDLERFTNVDYVDRMAFVGLVGDELVGVARYDRFPGRTDAEVAFFVDDAHAGRGIATVLLEYLAARGREVGLARFSATVLPQNRRMQSVFRQAGFAVTSRFADGVVEVEFPIEPTPEALAAMEARAKQAEARSVARLLSPRSIAVVGASRHEGTLGYELLRHLVAGGFTGPVHPVNREASVVSSIRAVPSVLDIPGDVDLAVIAVPAEEVPEVVAQCGRKRVLGLVVISEGFAETGPEGAEAERRLVEQARGLGMRLIGPNTMGVINSDPQVRMHATFLDVHPAPGPVGFSSQSGTVGAAVLEHLRAEGVGVSTFVATGNKGDVSGNDLLQHWEDDERTEMVMLYLESFGNPRNFTRIARRVARRKPILAVKAGRGPRPWREGSGVDRRDELGAGDPAVLGWPADATVDAMLRQTGVIRAATLEELFGLVRLLAHQPLPKGDRVAVLTNFWGPAVLAADACVANGLRVPELGPATRAALAARAHPRARLANPVELTADAGPDEVAAAASVLLASDDVDALIAVHAPPLGGGTEQVAAALAEACAREPGKPVVASFLAQGPWPVVRAGAVAVPVYPFPEGAALALGRVAAYAAWRSRPGGEVVDLSGTDAAEARAVADDLLHSSAETGLTGWIDPSDAVRLLATHGIEPVAQRLVDGPDDAIEVARSIGYPVALKAWGVDRPSKTEAGGVAVDVHGDAELRAAFARMARRHGAAMRPALVQAMAVAGADVAVEVHQHPALGSVLTVGPAGGGDAELRVVPLTDLDAERVLDGPALWRCLAPVDAAGKAALAELVLRLSALGDAVPEVADLRLDPVMVSAGRATPTDVRLRLAPWPRRPAVRRLGAPD